MNNVSFTGLGLTKQGNLYEKCKTGRRIGAVTGFLGGATAMAAGGSYLMLGTAAKICESNKKLAPYLFAITAGLTALSVIGTTLAGKLVGSIPDALVNKSRKNKADALAMNKQA